MSFFAESLFPILDYLTQQFIYVCWVPAFVAFVTLCVSSDKDRQYTRLVKFSAITTPCLLVLYISYFILSPKETFLSFFVSIPLVTISIMFNMCSIFWLVYGDDGIQVDLNMFHSYQLGIEAKIKYKYLRIITIGILYFMVAVGSLGGSHFFMITFAISLARIPFPDDYDFIISSAISVTNLLLLANMIKDKNAKIKQQMVEERSKDIITEEAAAEFADEKMAKQDPNTA